MAATTNKKSEAASRALVPCRISGAARQKKAAAKKRAKAVATNSNILDAEW